MAHELGRGTVLDRRYELGDRLGAGGLGTVYRAVDQLFQREVALKVLAPRGTQASDRLREEFDLLCTCVHPSLVRILDFARTEHQGEPLCFFTCELVPGRTLAEHARGQRWPAVATAFGDALGALEALHRAGIRHGDFKPANVLVRADGRGVLIDLSAARRLGSTAAGEPIDGTVALMAPELLAGEPGDARADLYSVGKTLDLVLSELAAEPSAALRELAARLCEAEPARRPTDVGEVLELLEGSSRVSAGASSGPSVPHLGRDRKLGALGVRGAAGQPAALLGRENEQSEFAAALESLCAARAGARAVVLTGPEGVGKSRLCRQLRWASQQRVTVVEGAPEGSGAVRRLLARALDRGEIAGELDALLDARAELGRGPRPRVLVLDGVDRLGADERALLEALVRATSPDDALLWLLTSRAPFGASAAGARQLALAPLARQHAGQWLAPWLPDARLDEVMALTGGFPALLQALCAALGRGTVHEGDLGAFAAVHGGAEPTAARVAALGAGARRALALLCVLEEGASPEALGAAGVDPRELGELELDGLARADARGWRLVRAADAPRLLERLPAELVRELGQALAAHARQARASLASATVESSALEALEARCLALGGQLEGAEALVRQAEPSYEQVPHAWCRAVETLCALRPTPENLASLGAALEAAGELERALGAVARAKRQRPPGAVLGELEHRAASCYEKLGRIDRALRQLERAALREVGPAIRAAIALLTARCRTRLGQYAPAAAAARAALSAGQAGRLAAELHEALGVAASYLGEPDEARLHLAEAVRLADGARSSPRARIRALSYQALHEYRAGDTRQAARGFAVALEIAEKSALGDQAATAALNLGTASHQLGDWGAALGCYERGLRAAVAYGKERTEMTLRFDRAKLFSDVGLFERSSAALPELQAQAERAGAQELLGALLGLRAEIAAGEGRQREAAELLERAHALHVGRGSTREQCECDLQAAELALATSDAERAAELLGRVAAPLATLGATDLSLRHATAAGMADLAAGRVGAAFERLGPARELEPRVAQRALSAELERLASDVYAARGAGQLATRHRAAAIEHWEHVASTLPDELRPAFWQHPRRAGLRRPAAAEPDDGRALRMMRLLAINRRLGSTLDTDEVLRLAMDSAVELTGAERGFVLLRRAGAGTSTGPGSKAGDARELEVAVARNVDREQVGRSHLKFSHGIARRVLREGTSVLTVDAASDERFRTNASVHAMRLRSILCVPIRAHGEVLGALYLDNRFERGRLAAADADLLEAFADQVAIALYNGRLLGELRARTLELEQEQRRVEQLMQSQAVEIDRLSEALRRERSEGTERTAYGEIVGHSSAMQRVFALLDKVKDSDVTVLIQGESGTGKELVARAIHFGGLRRAGPFVPVNCAALPEPLLESELFGHVKGAFTGATRDHAGLLVSARGGTLFLDELGETSPATQAKLLRALQEREVRPVGSDRTLKVEDLRLVCASNRRLRDEIAHGRFREDLYYRVSVVEIELPPLRERPEDIGPLSEAMLVKLAARHGGPLRRLSRGARQRLGAYAWPGNVRQLENVLARAAVMASGEEIGADDLELPMAHPTPPRAASREEFRRAEAERLRAALAAHGWNVCEVARTLGLPRTSLYRKLGRYGLLRP